MPTFIVRIDPDGTVTECEGADLLAVAQQEFKHTSVVMCDAPWLHEFVLDGDLDGPVEFVGVIDDFGAQDRPINYKAWACYGRSPIFGPMFFGYDSIVPRPPLPGVVLELLAKPVEDIVGPDVMRTMDRLGTRPEMMARRPS